MDQSQNPNTKGRQTRPSSPHHNPLDRATSGAVPPRQTSRVRAPAAGPSTSTVPPRDTSRGRTTTSSGRQGNSPTAEPGASNTPGARPGSRQSPFSINSPNLEAVGEDWQQIRDARSSQNQPPGTNVPRSPTQERPGSTGPRPRPPSRVTQTGPSQEGRLSRPPSRTAQAATGTSFRPEDMQRLR